MAVYTAVLPLPDHLTIAELKFFPIMWENWRESDGKKSFAIDILFAQLNINPIKMNLHSHQRMLFSIKRYFISP